MAVFTQQFGKCCALLALLGLQAVAQAQEWPSKPIRIIVPYTPGTGQDIIARTLAPKLTEKFGQPVVIDNRAGASGNIGMDAVAKAAPDGYTLLVTASTIVLNPLLYKDIGWDPFRDFAPVANVTTGYLALVVNTKVKANNVKEFIGLLKAQPGKLSYASTGVGTPQHLTGELFKIATNTFMLHVPYKGSAGAITGVIGGDVEAMFMPAHSALPQARQGNLKVLGVVSDKRVSVAPEIPTLQEAGGPNLEASVWYPMYAPAKTPPEIVNKISAAVGEIVKQKDVADSLNKQGLVVLYKNPQELAQLMRQESTRWGQVVKQKNLTAE
jgi:tripartite-type tricarboxylate transporter receptor subunit TctC